MKTLYKSKSTKDIPLEVIEHWLKDNNPDVRQAAIYCCEQNGIDDFDKSFPNEKTAL